MDELMNNLKNKIKRGTAAHELVDDVHAAGPALGDCQYCGAPFSNEIDDAMPSLTDSGICVGCVVESSYTPERAA